jgi:hypothetical protein
MITSPSDRSALTAALAIDQLVHHWRIDLDQVTDPELLAEVLQHDLCLHDLSAFVELLGGRLTEPQPLRPLLESIGAGLRERHPVVVDFVRTALAAEQLPALDPNGEAVLRRVLHHTYLLEILTCAMLADADFLGQVGRHYLSRRRAIGVRAGFWRGFADIYRITGTLFGPAKAKTMDYVFFSLQPRTYRLPRGTVVRGWLCAERKMALILNISEAVLTDLCGGRTANAWAGLMLILHPAQRTRVSPYDGLIESHYLAGWETLYQSWNLAFMLGNLKNFPLLVPKLLMPCVMNTPPTRYLYARSTSLWVTVNLQLFARQAGISKELSGAAQLASCWGAVNARFARQFSERARWSGGSVV